VTYNFGSGEVETELDPNQKLLIAAYDAFNARDLDRVLLLMHPNVDWPNGMEGGRVAGVAAVREYWTRQWTIFDPHVDPLSFTTDQEGKVVANVHQVVRDLSGLVLMDEQVTHIYKIQDGLILRMDISSAEALPWKLTGDKSD